MRHRFRSRPNVSNEILISRVANGWAVRMPEQYESQPESNDMGDAMTAGLKAVEPVIMEMYNKLHKDPLLDKLQNPEESNQDVDKKLQELSQPVIGQDESIYVFQTFNEVLNHLNQRFVDEDGD